jgi:cyclophilin family peptidyl-prolyl cis-trans isomerase
MRSACRWMQTLVLLGPSLLAADAARAGGLPCVQPPAGPRTMYEIHTEVGRLRIRFFDQAGEAPNHVANFLDHAEAGDYDDSFFSRLFPGFVIQGGGYKLVGGNFVATPPGPTVSNEPGICNVKGTLSMAKTANQPNSATIQWFINLADNTQNLGQQNGGFTVFAQVIPEDMPIVDALDDLIIEYGPWATDDPLVTTLPSPLSQLPVLEALPHDPAGYGAAGCLKVQSGFVNHPILGILPVFTSNCSDVDFVTAVNEHRADMEPFLSDRLVRFTYVPEPAGAWMIAAGAAVLAGARGTRRRA